MCRPANYHKTKEYNPLTDPNLRQYFDRSLSPKDHQRLASLGMSVGKGYGFCFFWWTAFTLLSVQSPSHVNKLRFLVLVQTRSSWAVLHRARETEHVCVPMCYDSGLFGPCRDYQSYVAFSNVTTPRHIKIKRSKDSTQAASNKNELGDVTKHSLPLLSSSASAAAIHEIVTVRFFSLSALMVVVVWVG